MTINRDNIEIMAPVGSFEALEASIQAGTNAVYFGAGSLNMRSASAANFSTTDLEYIATICRNNNINTYLTLNTVIYDEDIEYMKKIVDFAVENKINAIIASD